MMEKSGEVGVVKVKEQKLVVLSVTSLDRESTIAF
jgi:hypothetical protein